MRREPARGTWAEWPLASTCLPGNLPVKAETRHALMANCRESSLPPSRPADPEGAGSLGQFRAEAAMLNELGRPHGRERIALW